MSRKQARLLRLAQQGAHAPRGIGGPGLSIRARRTSPCLYMAPTYDERIEAWSKTMARVLDDGARAPPSSGCYLIPPTRSGIWSGWPMG